MKSLRMTKSVVLLLSITTAGATTWYVHPDSALNSIQAGLDSCADNDIVLVGPGTYFENIVWPNTHGIVLTSEYGPDATIIDGQNGENAVIRMHDQDSSTVINGFTIQNAQYNIMNVSGGILLIESAALIAKNIIKENRGNCGGGISLRSSSNARIIGNIITDNGATHVGGIYVEGSNAFISGNTITHNYGMNEGGGIEIFGLGSTTIIDNTIMHNTCYLSGGGISLWYNCKVIIVNNTISNNDAGYDGGGLFGEASEYIDSLSLRNNIITDNHAARNGGGIYCDNVIVLTIDSCMISSNNCDGIYIAAAYASPVIHYCNITDNIGYAVINYSDNVVDAEHNWWGDATGPYHPDSNPGGLGDTVSDYVDYDPWLTSSMSDSVAPAAPYVFSAKTGNDVELTWNMITRDTLGNAESVDYYVIYRSNSPSFIPGSADSIGAVFQPETTYTDVNALITGSSHYYLVKAVDWKKNVSKKSNMAFVFIRSMNENPMARDRKWTSLPW